MAITTVRTTTYQIGSGVSESTVSFDGTSCDYLIVGTSGDEDAGVSAMTYNAVSMTKIGEALNVSAQGAKATLWKLLAPASGSNNLVVTWSADSGSGALIGARGYSGVDQTTPVGTHATASGKSAAATVDVSSATDELVVDVVASNAQGITTPSVAAAQTEDYALQMTTGNHGGGGANEDGAGTVTMSWTVQDAAWAMVAVPLKPATLDISLTPGQGDITFSQTAPTLLQTADHQRDAGQGDLTLSTSAPTVVISAQDIDLTPGQGDITFSQVAPALTHTLDHQRDPGAVDLSLSATAPALTQTLDHQRDPGQGDLTLTQTAPTAAVSDHQPRDPGQGNLTLSVTAPALTQTLDHQRDPGQGDITFSTTAPTLATGGDVQRNPDQGDLTLSQTAPALTRTDDHPLSPGQGDLAITTIAPAFARTEDIGKNPGGANLIITSTAPSLTLTEKVVSKMHHVVQLLGGPGRMTGLRS